MKKKPIDAILREIKSASGYMGKRLICSECNGECDLMDDFCRWCGSEFPNQLGKKVINLDIKNK